VRRAREVLPRPFILLSALGLGLLCVVLAGGSPHPAAAPGTGSPQAASSPAGNPANPRAPKAPAPGRERGDTDGPGALPVAATNRTSEAVLQQALRCREASASERVPKPAPSDGPRPHAALAENAPFGPAFGEGPPSGASLDQRDRRQKKSQREPHPARGPPAA